ncbi:MAG: MoxR family ATPase [Anaerolineae bacterium]|nr:MoxR family ATPase [Anaerolineae bacterium]
MVAQETLFETGITDALAIRGWSHLDAVILAALATEAPLLLVGPHGTAKSLLVERIAAALGLEMRHYNAALLNYDDLVGIPLPTENGDSLRFIQTPGTIWGAEFVFFDEISRCRADLQNKLFPIIHERRVVGIKLDDLKLRWAAMNPPAPDEPDSRAMTGAYYLGSEPLDPALTDRFPFVIDVPDWSDLSKADRVQLVSWDGDLEAGSISPETSSLGELVDACQRLIPALEGDFKQWLNDYVVCVVDLLERNGLPQSPRRARMIGRSIVAVHAARIILEGGDVEPERSAEIALLYSLPQTATEVPPVPVKIIATHRQAWEMAQYLEDENWRKVMEEFDLARRVMLADQLGFDDFDMSRLITQTLGAEDSNIRQIGLATAMFLVFSRRRNLDPSAYEPLSQLAYHILEPRVITVQIYPNTPDAALWDEIKGWIESKRQDSMIFRLLRNFLLYGFPHIWRSGNWKDAVEQFHSDLMLFGIEEEVNS